MREIEEPDVADNKVKLTGQYWVGQDSCQLEL